VTEVLKGDHRRAATMRIPNLSPGSLYEPIGSARAPAGLPICQLSSIAAAPVSLTGVSGSGFQQSWRAATSFQPAPAAVVSQPAAPSRQQGFSHAPLCVYSPAEPALKEPLSDVLKRAGKRCAVRIALRPSATHLCSEPQVLHK